MAWALGLVVFFFFNFDSKVLLGLVERKWDKLQFW